MKEQILKAFQEGKTVQSRDGSGWKDFIRQNQLDAPNLDYRGIDNWRIKPTNKPHVNIGKIVEKPKPENSFLDLSKLSEEQQRKVIALLPENRIVHQYKINQYKYFLVFDVQENEWRVFNEHSIISKQELTYTQFVEMMGETSAENAQVEKIIISIDEIEKMITNSKIENKRGGDYRIALRQVLAMGERKEVLQVERTYTIEEMRCCWNQAIKKHLEPMKASGFTLFIEKLNS